MRLPVVLHRAHSERLAPALRALDFPSMALFALVAATRRHSLIESTATEGFRERLEAARVCLDRLEGAISRGEADRSTELCSLAAGAFEADLAEAATPRAIARLFELLFLLREAVADESAELIDAVPALALDCIYAQIRCAPGDCAAQTAEVCAAHAEAVREERAQLDDLERISRYTGDRAMLVRELTERARVWTASSGQPPMKCVPHVCGAL
ncbi:MAG: hypothetical protein H5U40_15120 [Polyangiaceae bacterium]|nr:hypothetical protein [Polyangiaceae bacterium]